MGSYYRKLAATVGAALKRMSVRADTALSAQSHVRMRGSRVAGRAGFRQSRPVHLPNLADVGTRRLAASRACDVPTFEHRSDAMEATTRLAAVALVGAALAAGCAQWRDRLALARPDDAAITTAVKARFLDDPTVSAMNVRVATAQGDVRLSGAARSREDAERAARLARSVKGVKAVQNDIRLGPES
jgi:osmotically-inducible protein OsmY